MAASFQRGAEVIQSHGGVRIAEIRQLGLDPSAVIDFSASVNPYGPSPRVAKAILRVRLDRYPDPESTELIEALSARLGYDADGIVVGNGATELLHAAARAWAGAGRAVALIAPTFGEYAASVQAAGARLATIVLNAADGFRFDLPRALQLVERERPSLMYLCNPNNPTGELISCEPVERLLGAVSPAPLLLDEAYWRFTSDPWDARELLNRYDNLVIVRSMTKDYGLTALRLGYALAAPGKSAELRRALPTWNVNGLAQAAGVAALQDEAHVDRSIERVQEAKEALVSALGRLSCRLISGDANFVLVDVGDAGRVRHDLAQRGLLVRDCRSFGLPRFIRISVRRPGENRRLVRALGEILG